MCPNIVIIITCLSVLIQLKHWVIGLSYLSIIMHDFQCCQSRCSCELREKRVIVCFPFQICLRDCLNHTQNCSELQEETQYKNWPKVLDLQLEQTGCLFYTSEVYVTKVMQAWTTCYLNYSIVDEFPGFDSMGVVLPLRNSSKGFHFVTKLCVIVLLLCLFWRLLCGCFILNWSNFLENTLGWRFDGIGKQERYNCHRKSTWTLWFE